MLALPWQIIERKNDGEICLNISHILTTNFQTLFPLKVVVQINFLDKSIFLSNNLIDKLFSVSIFLLL